MINFLKGFNGVAHGVSLEKELTSICVNVSVKLISPPKLYALFAWISLGKCENESSSLNQFSHFIICEVTH